MLTCTLSLVVSHHPLSDSLQQRAREFLQISSPAPKGHVSCSCLTHSVCVVDEVWNYSNQVVCGGRLIWEANEGSWGVENCWLSNVGKAGLGASRMGAGPWSLLTQVLLSLNSVPLIQCNEESI
jgi:hypothetical protein